jgi:hypothetical protein
MQRVKDVDRFMHELERPLPQAPGQPKAVTEAELEQDGENFMQFAKAFGIAPPRRRTGASDNQESVVPSAPAS